jgi:hypothetical protein
MTEVGQAVKTSRGIPSIRAFQTSMSPRGEEAVLFDMQRACVHFLSSREALRAPLYVEGVLHKAYKLGKSNVHMFSETRLA